MYFAGKKRGNIQNNVFYGSDPAANDSTLFRMTGNTSATLFMSTVKNYKVTGYYATKYLEPPARMCARGSFSAGQTCGPLTETRGYGVWSGRTVRNLWTFKWDSGPGIVEGDSGAPVYRVVSSNSVWAAGILVARNHNLRHGYFNPMPTIIAMTGADNMYLTK